MATNAPAAVQLEGRPHIFQVNRWLDDVTLYAESMADLGRVVILTFDPTTRAITFSSLPAPDNEGPE